MACVTHRSYCSFWRCTGDYLGDMGGFAWAVGSGGAIFGYNMAAWVAYPSPVTTDLLSVAMLREDFAVAVGVNGVILEWYGTSPATSSAGAWTVVASPTTQTLRSVGFGSTGNAIAVGDAGVSRVESRRDLYQHEIVVVHVAV